MAGWECDLFALTMHLQEWANRDDSELVLMTCRDRAVLPYGSHPLGFIFIIRPDLET